MTIWEDPFNRLLNGVASVAPAPRRRLLRFVAVQFAPAGETAASGPGNLDHVGFGGVDLPGTRAQLTAAGIAFNEKVVPRDGSVQIFVVDPDGIKVELNF